MSKAESLESLLKEIRKCRICEEHLPLGPNPVLRASPKSKLLIVGQAPGTRVHKTSIPWNDPSGVRLRQWLGMNEDQFYDPKNVAIVPMGFCYPGKGKSGDLPPRPECAETWHHRLLQKLPDIKLTLLIGSYAIDHFIGDRKMKTLTETVKNWKAYQPQYFPTVHPSPRNLGWLKKNPWFENEMVPLLRKSVNKALNSGHAK